MIEKNWLLVISLISFHFLLLIFASTISACPLEISEELSIFGANGTIERELMLHSDPGFAGQSLSEELLPIGLLNGLGTPSYFSSSLEFILDRSIGSDNSTIYYIADTSLNHSKHWVQNENFKLGVCTAVYYKGNHTKNYLFESSPYLSEVIVSSTAEGRSVLRARVVNVSACTRNLNLITWLEGNYTLDWNFLVIQPEDPEAGEEDYLPCP
jgi:hypothetical protein